MSHDKIFLATCNAIPLSKDVSLANKRLHYILLSCSSQFTYITKEPIIINQEQFDKYMIVKFG